MTDKKMEILIMKLDEILSAVSELSGPSPLSLESHVSDIKEEVSHLRKASGG